MNYICYSKWI